MSDVKITIPEAARRLNVSRQVLYRLISQGVLPAYHQLGRSNALLVNEADLENLADPVPVPVTTIGAESVSFTKAVALLHSRPTAVRNLIRTGELKSVQVPGGRERVLTSSIRAYLTGGDDYLGAEQAAG